MVARLGQRNSSHVPPYSAGYARRNHCAWDVTSGESAALISKFAYAKYALNPLSGTSAYQTLINAAKALNPNHKAGLYTIAYELGHSGAQMALIQSITRSGTTITCTCMNTQGTAQIAPPFNTGDSVLIVGSTGNSHNGVKTNVTVSGNTFTYTATGGETISASDTSGQALCMSTATVAYNLFNGTHMSSALKDMASWFLWKQGTDGRRGYWTTNASYATWFMNLTTWADVDANGDRWPQWLAKWYASANLFGAMTAGSIDFAFIDNYIDPRTDVVNDNFTFSGNAGSTVRGKMDWKRLGGTNWQNTSDADIRSAHRTGLAAFASQLRTSAGVWCMGNHDSANGTLPGELSQSVEAVFDELFMDLRSTSLSSWGAANFGSKMTEYAAYEGKLLSGPGEVILDCYLDSTTNYQAARFAICMALLRDIGVPCIRASSGSRLWYDEADQPVGAAIDVAQGAAYSGTLFKREYQGALVLLNAGGTTQNIDLSGQNWSYALGPTNPTVNNGRGVSTVSVPAWDAYLLVKR